MYMYTHIYAYVDMHLYMFIDMYGIIDFKKWSGWQDNFYLKMRAFNLSFDQRVLWCIFLVSIGLLTQPNDGE